MHRTILFLAILQRLTSTILATDEQISASAPPSCLPDTERPIGDWPSIIPSRDDHGSGRPSDRWDGKFWKFIFRLLFKIASVFKIKQHITVLLVVHRAYWVAGLFIGCVLKWRHLANACEVNAHLIGCWQNLGAICFWQPILSGLNLVVAAVMRDSLCVVSLLPCMADCCMLYTVCKVEWFVLINQY